MTLRLIAGLGTLLIAMLAGPTGASAMNKAELIDSVAGRTGMSRPEAQRAIDAVLQSIQQRARGRDSVEIDGFGTFSVSNRAARTGRNPQTGKPIQIPAHSTPQGMPPHARDDRRNHDDGRGSDDRDSRSDSDSGSDSGSGSDSDSGSDGDNDSDRRDHKGGKRH